VNQRINEDAHAQQDSGNGSITFTMRALRNRGVGCRIHSRSKRNIHSKMELRIDANA